MKTARTGFSPAVVAARIPREPAPANLLISTTSPFIVGRIRGEGGVGGPPRRDAIMDQTTEIGGMEVAFPSTSWSVIQAVQNPSRPEARQKLDQLIVAYWKPVYHFLRRRWSKSNEDAKELTQDFFTELLETDSLSRFTRERGTFRAYLKAALKYFMIDQERKRGALKQGGSHHRLPFDISHLRESLPEAESLSPEQIFDREWILACLDEALIELSRRLKAEGRNTCLAIFQRYYQDAPIFVDGAPANPNDRMNVVGSPTYEDLAREMNLDPHDVRNNLVYARQKLRGILKERVCDYSLSQQDALEELRFIFGE